MLVVAFAASGPLRAQAACDLDALKGQQRDVATIQRLENAWTVAYRKADTNFELCLLSNDFTEIV
jgi:invasion protein IalB